MRGSSNFSLIHSIVITGISDRRCLFEGALNRERDRKTERGGGGAYLIFPQSCPDMIIFVLIHHLREKQQHKLFIDIEKLIQSLKGGTVSTYNFSLNLTCLETKPEIVGCK